MGVGGKQLNEGLDRFIKLQKSYLKSKSCSPTVMGWDESHSSYGFRLI